MAAVTHALKQVVRNHLTVSSQLFVHQLVTEAWQTASGTARELRKRYDAEYGPDISRLFALLEHMLNQGYPIRQDANDPSYAEVIARTGTSVPDMLELDGNLLTTGQALMQTALEACEAQGDPAAANMLSEGIATRSNLLGWIRSRQHSAALSHDPRQLTVPGEDGEAAGWQQLNELIACTFAAIDQTTCHTLVLAHCGDESNALSTWRRSWLAMVHLGTLITRLAEQGWAIDTTSCCRADPGINTFLSDDPGTVAQRDAVVFARAAKAARQHLHESCSLNDKLAGAVAVLGNTLQTCANGDVPEAAMAYSVLPLRMNRWSYRSVS